MRVFAAFSFTQMMSSSWIISIRESSTLTMGLQWAYNGDAPVFELPLIAAVSEYFTHDTESFFNSFR